MAKLTKTKTPGIYRRGSRYVAVWTYRGRQHKESFRTLAEAREAKAGRQAGDRRPSTRVRFEEYFEVWIVSYSGRTAKGFSETSRGLYRRAITDHALPAWRAWKLSEIEPADVRDLFARVRERGGSTSQLKTLRASLSALFSTAAEDGDLPSNPIRGVRIPNADTEENPDEEKAKALTRSELRLLLAAVPEDWRLFFEFLAVTGLRISEAIGLRWEGIELGEHPHVKVREQVYKGERRKLKSGAGRREVPLSPEMAEALLAHRRDSYGGPQSPVFATTTGTPLSPANVRSRVLSPAAAALGLSVSFHTFRHTCASLLFAEGRNLKQVQQWLGHATASITADTYLHLMDDGVGEGLSLGPQGPGGGKGVATRALQTAANPVKEKPQETAR